MALKEFNKEKPSTSDAGGTEYPDGKKMNLDPYFSLYKKVHLGWVIDLIVRAKTIKFLEENIGENFYDHEVNKDFLERILVEITIIFTKIRFHQN